MCHTFQALVLATEPGVKREARSIPRAYKPLVIPVNSPVATFEQSENVAMAHLVGARAAACSEGCGLCNNRYRFKVHVTSICTCAQY